MREKRTILCQSNPPRGLVSRTFSDVAAQTPRVVVFFLQSAWNFLQECLHRTQLYLVYVDCAVRIGAIDSAPQNEVKAIAIQPITELLLAWLGLAWLGDEVEKACSFNVYIHGGRFQMTLVSVE
jgi:hypothetical protein